MDKKQGTLGIIAAIIIAIAGVFGADQAGIINLNLDFSTNTNIDSHDKTTIITNIIAQFGLDITPEELDKLCNSGYDIQKPLFKTACDIIKRNLGN